MTLPLPKPEDFLPLSCGAKVEASRPEDQRDTIMRSLRLFLALLFAALLGAINLVIWIVESAQVAATVTIATLVVLSLLTFFESTLNEEVSE